MDTDFQPLYKEKNKDDFSIWELQPQVAEPEPEIDHQAELEAECNRLREEARQAGYQEGLELADKEIKARQAELAKWLLLIQNPIRILDKQVSDEIMQTILWICKACIGFELSISPEKILAIIDDIKKELPAIVGKKQLAMNPLDKQWLEQQLDKKHDANILAILAEDNSLHRGDFFLHSEHCELNGRIQDRLQKILATYLPLEACDKQEELP